MTRQLLFNLFHVVLVDRVDVLLEWVDASIVTTAFSVPIRVISSATASTTPSMGLEACKLRTKAAVFHVYSFDALMLP